MNDSYGTYDGSRPEPPYECPECGDLQAKLQDAEEKLERANAYNASWIEDVEIQRDRLQAEVARLKEVLERTPCSNYGDTGGSCILYGIHPNHYCTRCAALEVGK